MNACLAAGAGIELPAAVAALPDAAARAEAAPWPEPAAALLDAAAVPLPDAALEEGFLPAPDAPPAAEAYQKDSDKSDSSQCNRLRITRLQPNPQQRPWQ